MGQYSGDLLFHALNRFEFIAIINRKESGHSNDTELVVLGVLLARICVKSPIRMIIFADVSRNLCSICIPDFNRAIATALTERGRDGAVNGT